MKQRHGKILITGAAKRIGAAMAQALAQDGWPIILHYNRAAAEAKQLQKHLIDTGGEVELMMADLAHIDGIQSLIKQMAQAGFIYGIINNASIFEYDDGNTVSAAAIESHMAVNLTAPTLLINALYQQLADHHNGSDHHNGVVINMLDAKLAGLNPDYFSYTLSKGAAATLTKIAAQAYAPHLRVNAIAPGIVLPSQGQSELAFHEAHRRNPLQQGATLSDIIAAMRFILDSPSMTGEMILLDGGRHLNAGARDVVFCKKSDS